MNKTEKLNKQVKSKRRVLKFGEVYTSFQTVNNIIDLVGDEAARHDSRFLDPACGDGNILIALLDRKLYSLEKTLQKNIDEFKRKSIVTLGSIYGIDKLQDNIIEARKRIVNKFEKKYIKLFGNSPDNNILSYAEHIVNKNIIFGDTLTQQNYESGREIVFSEWILHNAEIIKVDHSIKDLLKKAKG